MDPNIFFPVWPKSPAVRQSRMAKRTCRSCPVVSACLEWALDTAQSSGIWGGLNEQQRRRLPAPPAALITGSIEP
jgi:WhiB family redox-sensing transcriptional regulator